LGSRALKVSQAPEMIRSTISNRPTTLINDRFRVSGMSLPRSSAAVKPVSVPEWENPAQSGKKGKRKVTFGRRRILTVIHHDVTVQPLSPPGFKEATAARDACMRRTALAVPRVLARPCFRPQDKSLLPCSGGSLCVGCSYAAQHSSSSFHPGFYWSQ